MSQWKKSQNEDCAIFFVKIFCDFRLKKGEMLMMDEISIKKHLKNQIDYFLKFDFLRTK